MAQIFITLPDGTTTAYELPAQEGVVAMLGKQEGCQYVVDSPSISAVHCSFAKSGDAWYITDQNSSNGIYANGIQVTQTQLQPNVPYLLGEVYLYFLDESAQPARQQRQSRPGALRPVMRQRRAPVRRIAASPLSLLIGHALHPQRPKGMSGGQILLVILGLIAAFYTGLAIRHYQETGRNLPMEQLNLIPAKTPRR